MAGIPNPNLAELADLVIIHKTRLLGSRQPFHESWHSFLTKSQPILWTHPVINPLCWLFIPFSLSLSACNWSQDRVGYHQWCSSSAQNYHLCMFWSPAFPSLVKLFESKAGDGTMPTWLEGCHWGQSDKPCLRWRSSTGTPSDRNSKFKWPEPSVASSHGAAIAPTATKCVEVMCRFIEIYWIFYQPTHVPPSRSIFHHISCCFVVSFWISLHRPRSTGHSCMHVAFLPSEKVRSMKRRATVLPHVTMFQWPVLSSVPMCSMLSMSINHFMFVLGGLGTCHAPMGLKNRKQNILPTASCSAVGSCPWRHWKDAIFGQQEPCCFLLMLQPWREVLNKMHPTHTSCIIPLDFRWYFYISFLVHAIVISKGFRFDTKNTVVRSERGFRKTAAQPLGPGAERSGHVRCALHLLHLAVADTAHFFGSEMALKICWIIYVPIYIYICFE